MDAEGRTAVELATHRVHEAERHVAYFRNFVAELHRDGHFADQAEDLLRQLELALEEHREYLAQVQAQAAAPAGNGASAHAH